MRVRIPAFLVHSDAPLIAGTHPSHIVNRIDFIASREAMHGEGRDSDDSQVIMVTVNDAQILQVPGVPLRQYEQRLL